MHLLFVCTGNLCRSPMAEALFKRELTRRGCGGVSAGSAGTWASTGSGATTEARAVTASKEIDLSSHRARSLTVEKLERADVVIAMTSVHMREILALSSETGSKVLLLKHLPEIIAAAGSPASGDRVRALLSAPRPKWRREHDLDDPIGLPRSAYERCLGDIEHAVLPLVDLLCAGRPPSESRAVDEARF